MTPRVWHRCIVTRILFSDAKAIDYCRLLLDTKIDAFFHSEGPFVILLWLHEKFQPFSCKSGQTSCSKQKMVYYEKTLLVRYTMIRKGSGFEIEMTFNIESLNTGGNNRTLRALVPWRFVCLISVRKIVSAKFMKVTTVLSPRACSKLICSLFQIKKFVVSDKSEFWYLYSLLKSYEWSKLYSESTDVVFILYFSVIVKRLFV